jgi:hypothetical protein
MAEAPRKTLSLKAAAIIGLLNVVISTLVWWWFRP